MFVIDKEEKTMAKIKEFFKNSWELGKAYVQGVVEGLPWYLAWLVGFGVAIVIILAIYMTWFSKSEVDEEIDTII